MNKKYNYDEKSDSLFIFLEGGEEESFEEIAPGINMELDKNGKVIGIEILKASRFMDKIREHAPKR
ncbi:DUF2283 domain-containing protein [Candidatus Pacearchaeota archaeon]|nr:DUF2283 domain-containing protein [Candidatus Pacearchaeota archaeon]